MDKRLLQGQNSMDYQQDAAATDAQNTDDGGSLEEYWEAFELFDKDGDGTISTGELKNLLRCFDVDLPDEDVQQLIDKYDDKE